MFIDQAKHVAPNLAAVVLILIGAQVAISQETGKGLKAIQVEPVRAVEDKDGVVWVLAIGVEEYRNVAPLKFTGDDASAFGRAFLEVAEVPSKRVYVVTDDSDQEHFGVPTDSRSLRTCISSVLGFAKENDTLVFFFSGHGFAPKRGEMYLACRDFDPANPETTGISVNFLRDALMKCKAKSLLIFLDACHSGAFNEDSGIDGKLLATELAARKGMATITSSSGNQVSGESPTLKQGVFTYWLVQGIRGRANFQVDRWIDIQEAFRFVQQHVPASAKELNKIEQTPSFALKNQTGVLKVLELKNPDRPSVLVAAFNNVPVGNIGYDPRLIQAMASAASADPRLIIGRMKWIMEKNKPSSASYQAAKKALREIDDAILAGRMKLN